MIARTVLGAVVGAWIIYLTYLMTSSAGGVELALTSALRGAVLALLTAAIVLSGVAVLLEPMRQRLDQIGREVADYGDRREILGHDIASRAYHSARNGLRSVDA